MPGPGLDLVAHEPHEVLEEEEDSGDRSTLNLGDMAEEKLERPRRRFVKPGMTSYERCFSRHGAGRRLRQQQQQRGQPLSKLQPPVNQTAAAAAAGEAAAAPPKAASSPSVKPVSSLSSVLNQVIHGPSRALSSYEDVTEQPPTYKSFVVEQDTDGQLYVASLRGAQFVLPPAYRGPAAHQADAQARRSEVNLSFVHEPLDDSRLSMPRQSSGSELSAARGFLIKTPPPVEPDTKAPAGKMKSAKKLLGFTALKSKLAQRSSSAINSSLDTPSAASSGGADRRSMPAFGANGTRTTEVIEDLNASLVPMLDGTHVDRSRGDSSWEAPPAPAAANAEDETKPIVNRPLPTADFDDDEDDDPLNRSFLNVRDVDFERLQDIVRVEEEEAVAPPPALAAAAAARSTNEEAATYGRVRVASTGGANVTEFLGGFKGQLGYRSGQEGFNPRSRGLRNSRKGVSAAAKAASDLTRRLRDARGRIPFEFRGEPATAAAYRNRKFMRKGNQKRVHFDLTTNQCREFDVMSEYVPSAESLIIQDGDHEYDVSEDEDEDEVQSYDA